ncbi:MAG: rhodanese-like domain-containing protein [Desulfobaccales bacterium]
MQSKYWLLALCLLLSLAAAPAPGLAASPEIKYIDPATLKGMMGAPDLLVIDVSQGWWTYDLKIAGSLVFPEETSSWAPGLPKDKKIVLYCG